MRSRWIQIVAGLACIGLVGASSAFFPNVQAGRREMNMIGADATGQNTPPEYAFAIQAFGAFRGLITNIAFIRFEHFKERGRYYDAVQLGRWICTLQPRFPTVWEFMAWNMAWNISVTTYTPEERWHWVYNGAKLLRDEGLRYNPRAVNMYKQLAWTFNNKMGESVDDFHMSYKCYWAWHMHLLLGAPPEPPRGTKNLEPIDVVDDDLLRAGLKTQALNQGKSVEEARDTAETAKTTPTGELEPSPEFVLAQRAALDRIQAIHDAPTTLEGLYAAAPETREMVAQLRDLGVRISDQRLDEDAYWHEGGLAQTFFQRYRKLTDPPALRNALLRHAADPAEEERVARFDRIIGAREQRPAGQALLRFLQRKVLFEVYKMETDHMVELIRVFGPMDWRTTDSQSLYWVTLGIIRCGETKHSFQSDKTNTARIIFFSLRNLMDRNKLTFEPDPEKVHKSYLNMMPDLNFIEPMHQAYLRYGKLLAHEQEGPQGGNEIYRVGHSNFLSQAISMLYFSGRQAEARWYYDWLRKTYGFEADGVTPRPNYQLPLSDFVTKYYEDTIESGRQTREHISVALAEAYEQLAAGDVETYNSKVKFAADLWEAFGKEQAGGASNRNALPPLVAYQVDALLFALGSPSPNEQTTLHKARLWARLGPGLRQHVYDALIPYLTEECKAYGLDVAAAFPEPPDMAAFRKANQPREREVQEDEVETVPMRTAD